ncbi:MAG TPA: flagellar biosynthesis protein FlhB [Planctomycetes bacterium]|nr:flagellar biosynthesis protein FlhB [Planctomycetota bacterium]
MPEKPAAERTEQPTPKKLEKAREKGQVPRSQELTSVVTLLALITAIALLSPSLLRWFIVQVKHGMSCEIDVFADSKSFSDFINAKIVDSILVVCPILAALFAGSVLACVAISGLNFAPEAISLKFSQLNPVTGFAKLVNARSMVKLLVSIFKLLFVSFIVWFYLQSRLNMLASLRWAWSIQILAVIAKIILGLLIRVGIALLVIGVADAFYQKWKYTQELKMTRQEVKQERKDFEGSPELRSRIRRTQFEMARKRMLQEVPKATVVLVNPTHVAVALRYDAKTMESPVLVAKGAEQLAEKIREIARAYGVPVIRKPDLARTIYSTVKLGGLIPQTLYVAVAEVLAMIYRLRRRK